MGPGVLKITQIPDRAYVEEGQGVGIYGPQSSRFFGQSISAYTSMSINGRTTYYGPFSAQGGDVSVYRVVLKSGRSIHLWNFSRQFDLTPEQYMTWDPSSEAGFRTQIEFFQAQPEKKRLSILEASKWTSGLSDTYFAEILSHVPEDEKWLAAKILRTHLEGQETKSGDELLILIQGSASRDNREAMGFLLEEGLLTFAERLLYLEGTFGKGFLKTIKTIQFSEQELQEIPSETVVKLRGKISGSSDSDKSDAIKNFFGKVPGGVTAMLVASLSDSYKADAVKHAKYKIEPTKQSLIDLLLKTSDSYKADLLKANLFHGYSLSSEEVRLIFSKTSDSYKSDLIKANLLKGVAISQGEAQAIFKKVSDSYKSDLIKAGLLDGIPMTADTMLDLADMASSSYQGDILKALRSRYPRR
jgi:hypothetical protein